MALVLPDPRLEAPELLIPNRMPLGKVELDRSHPLSKGLVAAYIFNPNNYGGRLEDLSGNGNDLINLTPTKKSPKGHYFDLVERPETISLNNVPTDENMSVVCRASFDSWQTDGTLVRREDGASAWVLDVNNSVDLRFTRAGLTELAYAVTNLSLGRKYNIVASSYPGDNRLEIDGVVVDSNADTTWNAWGTIANPMYVGNEDGSNDEHEGHIELVYVYKRALERIESMALGLNPYRIWIPK
jgi:hypothetical protein